MKKMPAFPIRPNHILQMYKPQSKLLEVGIGCFYASAIDLK